MIQAQQDRAEQEAVDLLEAGLAHHRAGRIQTAAACYAGVLEADPYHAHALHLLGVVARQQGDLTASEQLLLAALTQDATRATYHHHLGKTYARQGKHRLAEDSCRMALSLDPQDTDSHQLLAELLEEGGLHTRQCQANAIRPAFSDLPLLTLETGASEKSSTTGPGS